LNLDYLSEEAKRSATFLSSEQFRYRVPNNADAFVEGVAAHKQLYPRDSLIPLLHEGESIESDEAKRRYLDRYIAVTNRGYHPDIHQYYWGFDYANSYLLLKSRLNSPLLAKMMHFWMGHFGTATTILDGHEQHFVGNYLKLIEREALGSFKSLMLGDSAHGCYSTATAPEVGVYDSPSGFPIYDAKPGIICDAASLLWLDGHTNTVDNRNENFPRESLELYTMSPVDRYVTGMPNYNDTSDITAVASFLSGYKYLHPERIIEFQESRHDYGSYDAFVELEPFYPNLSLRKASLTPKEFFTHIFENHPSVPRFIAGKLFSTLVYPDPEASVVEEAAQTFKALDYDIYEFVKILAHSEAMFSENTVRKSCFISPLESFAQVFNGFDISITPYRNGDDNHLKARVFFRELTSAVRRAGESALGYPSVFSYDYCGRNPGVDGSTSWLLAGPLLNRILSSIDILNDLQAFVQDHREFSDAVADLALKIANKDSLELLTEGELLDSFEYVFDLTLSAPEEGIILSYLNSRRNGDGSLTAVDFDMGNETLFRHKVAGLLTIFMNLPDSNIH
jgi:hypothetical protein